MLEKNRLAKRASLLRISALTLAENLKNGGFKSVFRGQGIEFSDVRDYFPGDNVRSIDWNVTARMGRPFIKQYEEDRELNVFLIVDCSESMKPGPPPVISEISTNLLKLQANDAMSSGASGLMSKGMVMWRRFCQGLAPSMALASWRSPGIDLRSPMQRIIM